MSSIRFVHAGVIAVLALVSATGCADISKGIEETISVSEPEEDFILSDQEHRRLTNIYGGYIANVRLMDYVERVGRGVLQANDYDPKKFTITVLNSSVVNAFALPGGYLYITRGLVTLAEDEAELASVLAHEIAHLVAEHTTNRYQRSEMVSIAQLFLLVVTGGVSEVFERGQKYFLSSYGRGQESEADQIAIHLLDRGGYDLHALSRVLAKLHAHSEYVKGLSSTPSSDEKNWFASHPSSDERIEALNDHITNGFDLEKERRVARDAYLRQIDGFSVFVDVERGPAQIKIVEVEKDTTFEQLVAEANLIDNLDWLLVINAMEPETHVSAGTNVKLIAYSNEYTEPENEE